LAFKTDLGLQRSPHRVFIVDEIRPLLSAGSRGLSSNLSQLIFVGQRNRLWIALKPIQPPRRAIFRSIHARKE
jgi:hypothetical protein